MFKASARVPALGVNREYENADKLELKSCSGLRYNRVVTLSAFCRCLRFSTETAPKAPHTNTPNAELGSGTEATLILSTNNPELTVSSPTSVTPSPKVYVPVVGIVKEKV